VLPLETSQHQALEAARRKGAGFSLPDGEEQSNSLRVKPPGCEQQSLGRGLIQPLCVVDDG
jgi:hypothetical protein